MALITDTQFLVHNMRLSYLREVEDPYGPRLIAFDPSYASNPYIVAASLADLDRWTELTVPSSPHISEDEAERPLGFPAARLHHTQTIMGNRTGALGIRVNGKRASSSKRMSGIMKQSDRRAIIGEGPAELSAPAAVADEFIPHTSDMSQEPAVGAEITAFPLPPNVQVQGPTVTEETPVVKAVQFVPMFARAAEMEARRKARIAARQMSRQGAGAIQPPPVPKPIVDSSSSEEDVDCVNDSSSDELGVSDQPRSIDEADDFDPEFAMTRATGADDSGSDAVSDFSTSVSNASAPMSPPHTNSRRRPRLSPVNEGKHRSHTLHPLSSNPSTELTFTRKKVGNLKPVKSSLSAIMASLGSSNPFAEMYAAVSGKSEVASINVQVYFPRATELSGTPMDLNVRKDATVEEVIGFALWTYWEKKWLPRLDEGLSDENDSKWEEKMSAVRWVLRIAEMDGEVDDDFPPPDRTGKIARFNSEAYAIIEATPTQVEQNRIIHDKIYRKADRPIVPGPNSAPAPTSAMATSTLGGSVAASSYLGPTNHGPQILLRIRIADHADSVHVSTTIPVSAGMYLQEALELVCRKRRQMDPGDYALLLGDQSLLVPLDRTVASLQGKRELLLVKRSMLPQYGEDIVRGVGKTTDPNASIFKRMSDTPAEVQFATDYTTAYKKYVIYRKVPMLVAKQERTLAIDGVYVHIMPSNRAKAVFDNAKTSSYHINSIAHCKQSTKMTSVFKLVLNGRAGGNKRYDFEAESPKHAAIQDEIVSTINNLKSALERSGTLNRARRSKQIG
ncbi:Stress-activated map kinase interacting protein 1 (SIN1) domain containing protein [Amanita muscaria]